MIRKILFSLVLVVMLLSINQKAMAQEGVDKIHHFIFKLQEGISADDNELIMDTFREKMDILAIDKCNIKRDGSLFIVTTKTDLGPEEIIAEIQSGEFPVSLTFLANFACDVAGNKEHFLGEFTYPEIYKTNARDTVGGIVVEPRKVDFKEYMPEE